MTGSGPAISNGDFTAQELNERILAWILSVRDAEDLSARSIEKGAGLEIKAYPNDPAGFYAAGKLADPWRYSLSSITPSPGRKSREIMFNMYVPFDKEADMTPVCIGLDFYKEALIAAGFTPSSQPPRLGVERRHFRSEKARVLIHLRGKAKRYDEQLCVFKVYVNATLRKD